MIVQCSVQHRYEFSFSSCTDSERKSTSVPGGAQQYFSVKDSAVNISGFVDHTVSIAQLCQGSIKATLDNGDGHGHVPIKLYIPKQGTAIFGLWTLVGQLLLYTTTRRAKMENVEHAKEEKSGWRADVTCLEPHDILVAELCPESMHLASWHSVLSTAPTSLIKHWGGNRNWPRTSGSAICFPLLQTLVTVLSPVLITSFYKKLRKRKLFASLCSELSRESRLSCFSLKEVNLDARTGPLPDFQYSRVVENTDVEPGSRNCNHSSDTC